MRSTPRRKASYDREYYFAHKEAINARRRARYRETADSRPKLRTPSIRANWKRYYEKHKQRLLAQKRESYKKNKHWEYVRNRRKAFQEQTGGRPKPKCCDVCGNDNDRIEFDHCHQRGVFRGWLCGPCNRALGQVKDNPDVLRKLIAYLERTKDLVAPQAAQMTLPGV